MSDPKRHHFIPEFFLSAWLAPTTSKTPIAPEVLIQYRKPWGNEVRLREVTPAMVCNGDDLYRLRSETILEQRVLETTHYQKLDSVAAPILAKVIADHGERFTDLERFHLTRFILSLPARTPWAIKQAIKYARETFEKELGDPAYAKELGLRGMTVLEAFEKNPHFVADEAMLVTIRAQTDPKKRERLLALDWITIDTSDAGLDLILGDNAFMVIGNLLDPAQKVFIAVPFAPNRILIMTNQDLKRDLPLFDLVQSVNRESAGRAQERFFARGRGHLELAEELLREFRVREP